MSLTTFSHTRSRPIRTERFGQLASRPVQSGLDCPTGNPQHRRDLLVRQLFELPEHQDVPVLRGEPLQSGLQAQSVTASIVTIPAGERFKNLATIARLYDAFLAAGLDRKSLSELAIHDAEAFDAIIAKVREQLDKHDADVRARQAAKTA